MTPEDPKWVTARIRIKDGEETKIFNVGGIRNNPNDRDEFTRRIVDNGFNALDGWYPPHQVIKVDFE
jgi:hypothetical protein